MAAGARNPLQNLGTELTPSDAMTALGYFVPAERDHIDIQFFAGLAGYIWIFPRCGHLSVGICGKEPAASLRTRLETYMVEQGISKAGATYYGHVLPSLESRAWKENRVAGDGWMAVGDAAGLVDPITGEGLYYALRSADLAAQAITGESVGEYHHFCNRISRMISNLLHGLPITFSMAISLGIGCGADGAVYPVESDFPRDDAGFVCRNAAVSGVAGSGFWESG